jgi:hypothetical protein
MIDAPVTKIETPGDRTDSVKMMTPRPERDRVNLCGEPGTGFKASPLIESLPIKFVQLIDRSDGGHSDLSLNLGLRCCSRSHKP